ncbi:MAG TPA: hypothetical protein VFW62_08215, partial [bacterium]|nr:hypothetical protein [bacterium]
MASKDRIEKKLKGLRKLIERGEEGEPVAFHAVPAELAREGGEQLVFTAAEKRSLLELQASLAADSRFEHLEKGGWLQLVDFVARVQLERQSDHVGDFMEKNAKDPQERTCYFPVELLALSERVEVAGVSLLPMSEGEREKL